MWLDAPSGWGKGSLKLKHFFKLKIEPLMNWSQHVKHELFILMAVLHILLKLHWIFKWATSLLACFAHEVSYRLRKTHLYFYWRRKSRIFRRRKHHGGHGLRRLASGYLPSFSSCPNIPTPFASSLSPSPPSGLPKWDQSMRWASEKCMVLDFKLSGGLCKLEVDCTRIVHTQ